MHIRDTLQANAPADKMLQPPQIESSPNSRPLSIMTTGTSATARDKTGETWKTHVNEGVADTLVPFWGLCTYPCYPLGSTGLAMLDAAPAPLRFDDRFGSAGPSCIHSPCPIRSLFLSGGRGYQEYKICVTVDKVTGSASTPWIPTRATSASLGSQEILNGLRTKLHISAGLKRDTGWRQRVSYCRGDCSSTTS